MGERILRYTSGLFILSGRRHCVMRPAEQGMPPSRAPPCSLAADTLPVAKEVLGPPFVDEVVYTLNDRLRVSPTV